MAVTAAVPRETSRDEQIAALFASDYVRLCRMAALLLDDRAAAEEAVMDAFAEVLTGWRRIRDVDRAPAYLQRAVVNRCRSLLRRRGPEQRATATLSQALTEAVPLPEPTDHIGRAVDALPARQREAVVLTFWMGLSEADAADAMGCSRGTVKSTLSKARASLAAALAEEQHRG